MFIHSCIQSSLVRALLWWSYQEPLSGCEEGIHPERDTLTQFSINNSHVFPRRKHVIVGRTRTRINPVGGDVNPDIGAKTPSFQELELFTLTAVGTHTKHSNSSKNCLNRSPGMKQELSVYYQKKGKTIEYHTLYY